MGRGGFRGYDRAGEVGAGGAVFPGLWERLSRVPLRLSPSRLTALTLRSFP